MARTKKNKAVSQTIRVDDEEVTVLNTPPAEDEEEGQESEGEDELEPADDELIDEDPLSEENWTFPELSDSIAESLEAEEKDLHETPEGVTVVTAPSRSLTRFDPMQAYINQARTYSLLTPEEEHDLAVRFRETGDLDAAKRLITSNLRLVVKIAHEYRKAYRHLLDLVQEGNIGLMHAVNKFDPYRGVRLSSYAAWWIRAYILKFILNNWRMVKIGTTQVQRKLFFNLRKEIDRLEAIGIENPGPKLLAERLEVPEAEVQSMQRRLAGTDVSLDAPVHSEDTTSSSRLDFVSEKTMGPDRATENREFSELLQEKLKTFGQTLHDRDKEIFELRTVAEEPLTLQEIGDRYGITRERARQIERRMLDRLRDYLKEELGDAVDVALNQREDE